MPQSGVTSDDSWYLTSFVILSFYYLPVCLTLLTVQTQINSFLNGEYRRFWVLLLRAERRGLYFVASAVLALSIHSDAADFSYQADRIYLSTQLTHTYVIIAREPMTGLLLHRGFVDILTCHGIDGNSDMPPHLTKWVDSSVHGTAPPSPKFPAEFCRCCSLG